MPFSFRSLFLIALVSLIPFACAESPLPPSFPKNATRVGWVAEPNCGRGTSSILWQCITTIFLCVYTAFHYSPPTKALPWRLSLLNRVFWTIVGLLAPEFVCGLAIGQFVGASGLRKRAKALGTPLSLAQSFILGVGGIGFRRGTFVESLTLSNGSNIARRPRDDVSKDMTAECPSSTGTKTSHTGGAGMTWIYGFSLNSDGDSNTLQIGYWQQDALRFCAQNCPDDEVIDTHARSDWLGKSITVAQALWTIAQIITRAAQQLDISLFEFMTVGYLTVALISYVFWFSKPYNLAAAVVAVHSGIVTTETDPPPTPDSNWIRGDELGPNECQSFGSKMASVLDHQFFGSQELEGYPLGGCFFVVAAIFATSHFLGWNFAFASTAECWLWRSCCILLVVCPLALILLGQFTRSKPSWWQSWGGSLLFYMSLLLYVLSRIYMLVEVFLAFRNAPVGIYRKISWTQYLGHFGT